MCEAGRCGGTWRLSACSASAQRASLPAAFAQAARAAAAQRPAPARRASRQHRASRRSCAAARNNPSTAPRSGSARSSCLSKHAICFVTSSCRGHGTTSSPQAKMSKNGSMRQCSPPSMRERSRRAGRGTSIRVQTRGDASSATMSVTRQFARTLLINSTRRACPWPAPQA